MCWGACRPHQTPADTGGEARAPDIPVPPTWGFCPRCHCLYLLKLCSNKSHPVGYVFELCFKVLLSIGCVLKGGIVILWQRCTEHREIQEPSEDRALIQNGHVGIWVDTWMASWRFEHWYWFFEMVLTSIVQAYMPLVKRCWIRKGPEFQNCWNHSFLCFFVHLGMDLQASGLSKDPDWWH